MEAQLGYYIIGSLIIGFVVGFFVGRKNGKKFNEMVKKLEELADNVKK